MDTIWPLEPHTAAKHEILRRHLGAWFPIMCSWNRRLVFVDGFAGPGQYAGGEPGSPVVALRAASEHESDLTGCRLLFRFIEADRRRHDHLRDVVDGLQLPEHIEACVKRGVFTGRLSQLEADLRQPDTAGFVMLDPFGVKDVTLAAIRRLASFRGVEMLISFMYEGVSRWLDSSEMEPHLDLLFETTRWRDAKGMDPAEKREFLHNLFIERLHVVGMQYVRSFEMRDASDRPKYFLIFGTHHPKGLEVMKQAMWKVDESGRYEFSDATNPDQPTLFEKQPDYDQLTELILGRFKGREASIAEVLSFVLLETAFLPTHVRKNVLVPLENDERIDVTSSRRKRARSYPDGTQIRFLA